MKTIFSKYIISFILLFVLAFTVIAVVLSSVVSGHYSQNQKKTMSVTAEAIYSRVFSLMEKNTMTFSQTCISDKSFVIKNVIPLAEKAETLAIITNAKGEILVDQGAEKGIIGKKQINVENLMLPDFCNSAFVYNTLDGVFPEKRMNFIYTVIDEKTNKSDSLIILSSCQATQANFTRQIIAIIICSCVLMLLAVIILVYFITARISSSLKSMSVAVKSYSKGVFSDRIKVTGNNEISDLAKDLNEMAEKLESFEKTRSSFLSNVIHDLRTPMTSIQGFVDGILDGTIPQEKQSYYLGVVSKEVKRLSRLVGSLLEVLRLESGKMKFNKTNFDICEVTRLILISFEDKINEKKLEIQFESDKDIANVYADRDSIYQVLYNLTDNAIKFIDEQGLLKISIKDTGPKYEVSVFNTGVGIKEEELPYIFDSFYKSDTSKGINKTGTGLGLYIVKTKLELQDESISVESQYNKNCCFKFTLTKALKQV